MKKHPSERVGRASVALGCMALASCQVLSGLSDMYDREMGGGAGQSGHAGQVRESGSGGGSGSAGVSSGSSVDSGGSSGSVGVSGSAGDSGGGLGVNGGAGVNGGGGGGSSGSGGVPTGGSGGLSGGGEETGGVRSGGTGGSPSGGQGSGGVLNGGTGGSASGGEATGGVLSGGTGGLATGGEGSGGASGSGGVSGSGGSSGSGSGGASGSGGGSSGGTGGAGVGGGGPCMECGDGCVDLETDVENCGACGHACSSTHAESVACVGGECRPECAGQYGNCRTPDAPLADDGCETNLDANTDHCGACERECSVANAEGTTCVVGVCQPDCTGNYGDCESPTAPDTDDGCETNLQTSEAHCGACGRACSLLSASSTECVSGACVPQCSGEAVDCETPEAPSADDGCETDLQTSAANCGACGRACSLLNASSTECVSGACDPQCSGQFGNCVSPEASNADDGCETDLQTSEANCGACGRACSLLNASSTECVSGACEPQCSGEAVDCETPEAPSADDGCETDEQTSAAHCGACGRACSLLNASSTECVGGACEPQCSGEFGNCASPEVPSADDGCETDLQTSEANCGACGRACSLLNASSTECVSGACEPQCSGEAVDCETPQAPSADDGCTDVQTSAAHCGACQAECTTADCREGRCQSLSCAGMAGDECQGESCCTSLEVPAGSAYPMGRGLGSDACPAGMTCYASEEPEHPATVSGFELDKYEVTVGRFRAFVAAFGAGWRPGVGEGEHPVIPGTGWGDGWPLPASQSELEELLTCFTSYETWRTSAGSAEEEAYPLNCVNWYEAEAFCIWDGGRLPTEAEWEKAAAGGEENRLYPWGGAEPNAENANWSGSAYSPFTAVGTYQGLTGEWNGRWGHADLAGSLWEWAFDWYASDYYTATEAGCADCCGLVAASGRVLRGGYFNSTAAYLRSALRNGPSPTPHSDAVGFRCSRSLALE